ncbi:MAG: sensor domain-containing diguanylate cyclase [Aeromicrobium sp.]
MAHALASSSPVSSMLETAAEEARTTLHAASVSISCVEALPKIVRTIINVGDLGPDEVRWPEDEVYVISEVSRLNQAIHGRTAWTESLEDPDCEPFERELLLSLGKGSSLATPIFVDGYVWGELYLTRHVGATVFDGEAIAYAEVLSAMLGAAVARSLREAALVEVARRDPLTGLSNRRGLDEFADQLFTDGVTRVAAVLSVDINGLKLVNDSHGHARGDVLIHAIGRTLEDAFGELPRVCVARVGGDEYTVIVADHPVDDLIHRMNNACDAILELRDSAGVSAGLATSTLCGDARVTPTGLFAAADRAQYAAKRSRSRDVVVAREW